VAVGGELTADPIVRKLSFTGSTEVGKLLMRQCADTMKKVSETAGTHLSPHDLRRTFADIGYAECGVDLSKVKQLLNHKPHGVTEKHYLKTSKLQYLLPEVQRVADWIEQQGKLAEAIAKGENVVPLRA
jgi:integrase